MTRKRATSPRRARSVPRTAHPSAKGVTAATSDRQVRTLLYELQVHSEEITVQNEQLLKAQAELEQARDRYADLYDFAPIGYLSIDSRASIVDINLAAAGLFGRPRSAIVNLPLASLIAPNDLDTLREFLIASRQGSGDRELRVDLAVRRRPGRIVRLLARPLGLGPGASHLLTAVIDVTDERRLEADRADALRREQERGEDLSREVAVRTRAEARVKALLERIVSVQEAERRRIALNLHDHLGQQLTALRLTIGALKDEKLSASQLRRRIETIDAIVGQLDKDLDFLAWDLRPASLDDVGLSGALTTVLREWTGATGIAAQFHAKLSERLKPDVESQLYRIVQEALNNVSKHSHASNVSVLLERRGEDVTLVIEDDGRGFDADRHAEARPHHGGMGLIGMQERAALIGGRLNIEAIPGKGTSIFVRVPIPAAVAEKR